MIQFRIVPKNKICRTEMSQCDQSLLLSFFPWFVMQSKNSSMYPTEEPTAIYRCFLFLLFSRSVVSDSLWFVDCSTPGFPVLYHPLELAQTHAHWVGDAIQPSHPLLSPSPPAFNLSQSCPTLCNPTDCSLPGLLCPCDSLGKNTAVCYQFLLQGIFLTQGSNLCLQYCG